ncbi:Glyco-hydro-79C domain-containing protein [Mycena kentingensis (nom. inval.)]|nr:Glyco-hydro-79C domain-containing protein [Mycena kentingensis (nom. inval.)]
MRSFLLCVLPLLPAAWAEVTVYYQYPLQQATRTNSASAAAATYTGSAAYDPTVLQAPPVPVPPPPTTFFQQLSIAVVPGVSINQQGYFLGFSIEFSVFGTTSELCSSRIQVPFLNLLSNVVARAGSVRVRIGGNTQDYATMVDSLADGRIIEKSLQDTDNPTNTPATLFTPDILYTMANISSLVNVDWYLGIPLNDTNNLRLQIVEASEAILGDRLIGYQVGNEPDEYALHNQRPLTYSPQDYSNEFGLVEAALRADAKVATVDHKLLGPSVSGQWDPQQIWDVNFIPAHQQSLQALSMQRYPKNNCARFSNTSAPVNPQDVFASYLDHTAGQKIAAQYLPSTALAQSAGLPFVMLETNTASCGGFPGLSNSFGAALWALDYTLQLAYSNFTTALLHVAGQGVYYNPFTPPPTNQSTFRSWTIAPIYYSVLAVAETIGSSGKAQIIDLQLNAGNIYTPGYAVYENGTLARLALLNFVTDPSGTSDYTMTFAIGGGTTGAPNATPAQVQVKYLRAPSVSTKDNITWAGQTFGAAFQSDGRIVGTEDVQTVTCNTDNTCAIKVPAPGFALVFLANSTASKESFADVKTFATTALTKTINTASVDPTSLANSNGHAGANFFPARTSKGKQSAATRNAVRVGSSALVVALGMALGVVLGGN